MMNEVLEIVSSMLNEHLKKSMNINEEKCVVSNLIRIDKSIPDDIQNKIIVSFINLEESYLRNSNIGYKADPSDIEFKRIDLSMMITFNLDSYQESLTYLTSVFGFLQANAVLFSQEDTSKSTVSKLTLSHQSLNTETLANIWSFIGIPYLPSLMYKMNVIYR